MAIDRACHYMWQSTQGLDHAFRVGVIHRDIKPGNILVDRAGVAKILDMGLARFYHTDDDMLTKKYDEKSVLGTADYVAPEQTINSHDVDVRADIYSLGATFYFLLAGHPPFPEGTVSQKLIAHQTKQPIPVDRLRPEIPPELSLVIRRMMAKSITERFQTPAQVYDALKPFSRSANTVPPEDEMPVLSPAARELSSSSSTPGSGSGSFRQDSAVMQAEMMQRSGRIPPPPAHGRTQSAPPKATMLPQRGSSGQIVRPGPGSSNNMPPPYFEPPPMVSPLGSAANPPVPNPTRPFNETARMAETTDRAAAPRGAYDSPANRILASVKEVTGRRALVKIVLESVLVFGACLVLYFIFRALWS
jgi:serine/threonine protein kinase